MKWISVKDKKPKKDQRVLVYDRLHNEITIGEPPIGNDDFWWVAEGFDPYNRYPIKTSPYITFWMPLPEPPKK